MNFLSSRMRSVSFNMSFLYIMLRFGLIPSKYFIVKPFFSVDAETPLYLLVLRSRDWLLRRISVVLFASIDSLSAGILPFSSTVGFDSFSYE